MITTIILATLAAQNDGITMKFISHGAVQRAGGYRPIQVKLADAGTGIKKAPADLTAARYGILTLGGKSFGIILDEPEGKPARLFVDSNGDGDYTNDPAAEFALNAKNKVMMGSGKIELSKGETTPVTIYHFDRNDPARAAQKDSAFYYGDYGYQVDITLGGKKYTDFIAGDPAPKGRFWIDRNGDGKKSFYHEYAMVGEPFNFTGTTYQIDFKDGKYALAKSDKAMPMAEAAPILTDGSKCISFTATTTDGKTVHFPEDYKGKIVMLDFWATWCGPCKAELPNVIKGYNANHDKGFDILAVSFDREGDGDKLAKFTADNKMPWPQIFEGKFWDTTLGHKFDVAGIPFALLVDGDTGLILSNGEEMRGEKFSDLVSGLLAKKGLKGN